MKKVSTRAAAQSRNISPRKLTTDWIWEIATVGTACWMKRVRSNWSSGSVPMRRRCAKSSEECHAVGSHWKSGCIRRGSAAC